LFEKNSFQKIFSSAILNSIRIFDAVFTQMSELAFSKEMQSGARGKLVIFHGIALAAICERSFLY